MQGSQLLDLIKTLTKHDMRELRKVVRSPYFNQREDVVALFDYIDTTLNSRIPALSKEKVFKSLFPNKSYDDVLMRQTMSYLHKIIQKYLITEGVLENDIEAQMQLTKALRQRNAEKIFEKQLFDFLKKTETQYGDCDNIHYVRYKSLCEDYEYKGTQKREAELNLQELSNELDYFYFRERLHRACIMFAHKNVTKHNYAQPLLDEVLEYVEKMGTPPPSVSAYYNIYKVISEPDVETHYARLKSLIIVKNDNFSQAEKRDMYISAINYCIKRINKGEKQYNYEAIELFEASVKTKTLLENGVLQHYDYKNMIMIAIKVEEYEKAENFLHDFKQFLSEKDRENIYNYNLAIYHFRKGNYGAAMPLLQTVTLNDVLYNLDSRRMLARIYFDTDEIMPLQSLIESSKVYLHRQKDIGYHHDMYANFFRFLDRMMKHDLKNATFCANLLGEVEKTQLLAERDWIVEKLKSTK